MTAKAKTPVKPKKQAAKPARGKGRPSNYKAEYAAQAQKFCLLGATDEQLAVLFEVAVSTIYLWKQTHPDFSEALRQGKEVADAEVAAALFHRAKGYSHAEDDIRTVSGPSGTGSEIVITPTIKHYPPDTAAAMSWLKNRQPDKWREKVEHEHAGKNGGPIQTVATVTVTPSEAYRLMLGAAK